MRTQTPDSVAATSTSSPTGILPVFTGILPTLPPSPTVMPPDVPTRLPSTCEQPDGWTTYSVEPGNTLLAIAIATDSTLEELRYANCIEDVDTIAVDDVLYVPNAPLRPVPTIPSVRIRAGLARVGCGDSRTQITSPIAVQRVSGTFSVFGSATRDDFWYYKIEVRPDWADTYNFYLDSHSPVVSGRLGDINSDIFGDGLHWIRLSVVNRSANIPDGGICEIPVVFE